MRYEQFLEIYNRGPKSTYELLSAIMQMNRVLIEQSDILGIRIKELEARVKELKAARNKNSGNSNKHPSSDEFIKPKSSRKKSGRKSGGQEGHKGQTLKMSDAPDDIITHEVKTCLGCGHSLEEEQPSGVERRQVFDLPPLRMNVAEHRAESKLCPCRGLKNNSLFPDGVELPVQYGCWLNVFRVEFFSFLIVVFKMRMKILSIYTGNAVESGYGCIFFID